MLAGEALRFGSAAAVNTAFGYGAYAAFVWLGLHPYLAQILAQVAGALFNSKTYAIAFRTRASRTRFLLSYAVSYFVGLALLVAFTHLVASPYLAGALTMVGAACFNFLVLRQFVFHHRVAPV